MNVQGAPESGDGLRRDPCQKEILEPNPVTNEEKQKERKENRGRET